MLYPVHILSMDAQAERVPAHLWYHWHMRRVWVLFGGSL